MTVASLFGVKFANWKFYSRDLLYILGHVWTPVELLEILFDPGMFELGVYNVL